MSHCKTNIKVTVKLLACIYKCACMLINANFSGNLINSPTSFTMVLFVEIFIHVYMINVHVVTCVICTTVVEKMSQKEKKLNEKLL